MAFVSEIFDQLRALLNDPADAQVPYATKKLYVNRGIALLWPGITRIVEYTVQLAVGTEEYSLPAAIGDGLVLSVELSLDADALDYSRIDSFEIMAGNEDESPNLIIRDARLLSTYARWLRVTYAAPVPLVAASTYVASQSEVWSGPDRALGLPVLYAMAMISAGKVDDRQDHTRYSTTQALNGVSDGDILTTSQTWFNQFYAELEQLTRPLPPTRD